MITASNNVRFYFGTQSKYDALTERESLALYFIEDTQRLYKGDVLMATGADASSMAAGLMSSEDKIKLDSLTNGTALNLSPVDGTITITDDGSNGKLIGVAISPMAGNALTAVDGGLFVPVAEVPVVPEYSIEKQDAAESGYASSYKLKKTVGDEVSYVGDTINIAKDLVLQSATMQVVAIAGVPYEGGEVGDPYIDMAFNDENASHIYLPVKGLVDIYVAGDGIEIINNKVSVKLSSVTNGLSFVDGSLTLNLATRESSGAMSAQDKLLVDSVPYVYETVKYEISSKPAGTLVSYREDEIRVMCPANTEWVKQNVGSTGNANMYYMGFKAYAPAGAVSFKEGDRGVIVDEMFTFDDAFAGTDEFGRNYSIVWLALASYDESSDSWTYFGKNSTTEKYVGWTYVVEWYDGNGVVISSDSIRINLSNEDCHTTSTPYYMNNYATAEQIKTLESSVESITESYSWGEL